ncbi:MAG: hypothetical protein EAZ98_09015 [Oscillatoriales cyanobacterium]|nr:MAG: hypothetical protein EAZ98_09015 [Oscillatoriales cyanobacterium]TAE05490.1 MAG: hypothetical protein EAZ96_05275 [Oscillatoriales cyanobacterium]
MFVIEGRRKKEEGRRKKEEGRRKKEEEPPPYPPQGGKFREKSRAHPEFANISVWAIAFR